MQQLRWLLQRHFQLRFLLYQMNSAKADINSDGTTTRVMPVMARFRWMALRTMYQRESGLAVIG